MEKIIMNKRAWMLLTAVVSMNAAAFADTDEELIKKLPGKELVAAEIVEGEAELEETEIEA